MLQRLLSLMGTGGLQSVSTLATALGLSEPLVRQMLDQLTQQGYLRAAVTCADGCAGCALQTAGCGTATGFQGWALTERGRQAIRA